MLHIDGDGTILHTRVITNRRSSGEADECLCTDLRSWSQRSGNLTRWPPS